MPEHLVAFLAAEDLPLATEQLRDVIAVLLEYGVGVHRLGLGRNHEGEIVLVEKRRAQAGERRRRPRDQPGTGVGRVRLQRLALDELLAETDELRPGPRKGA